MTRNRKVIIVAGIARSGLTVTMQMLHAGGYPCAGEMPAFEPYPLGQIPWEMCAGKAVKAVDIQLQFPPPMEYKVILLQRDLKQQALSTRKFLQVVAGLGDINLKRCVKSFKKDYKLINRWADAQDVLRLRFEDITSAPFEAARSISGFVGGGLDVRRMCECVIPRGPDCHERLLELGFVRQ